MAEFENSRTSPLSDILSENGGNGNTLEKALIKKNILLRNQNGSFKAGYIPVNEEEELEKSGISGRKTYAFWTLVFLLLLLAAGNLLLTFTVLGVLRLGQGMESIEFVPEESLIKFYGRTDLGEIIKRDGHLEGFGDSPVSITSENQHAVITVLKNKEPELDPKVSVRHDGLAHITKVQNFEIKDAYGNPIFSTEYPNFGLPRGVKKIDVKAAKVGRISAPVHSSLSIGSDTYVTLKGNEGTRLDGKEIVWSADQDLLLRSVNGSIYLTGKLGVSLDVQGLPLSSGHISSGGGSSTISTLQYKLCICKSNAKLFTVRLPDSCLTYANRVDPCSSS